MFESHKHLEVVKVLESANLTVLENVSSDLIENEQIFNSQKVSRNTQRVGRCQVRL